MYIKRRNPKNPPFPLANITIVATSLSPLLVASLSGWRVDGDIRTTAETSKVFFTYPC
jgi:hypothetical protein